MTTEEKLKEMLGDYYEMGVPGSPNAAILQNMLGADNELRDPQSENETLLKLIYEDVIGAVYDARDEAQAAAEAAGTAAEAVANKAPAITDTASGPIASFPDGADGIPVKSLVVNVEPVQEGSGDPSPDNVRPITGWTGAKVSRTGANTLNIGNTRTITVGGLTAVVNADGTVTVNGQSIGDGNIPLLGSAGGPSVMPLKGGVTYTIYRCNVQLNGTTSKGGMTSPTSFTAADGDYISYVWLYFRTTEPQANSVWKPQLEVGSTASAYTSYAGHTYHLTFPTEAGTVYGGTDEVVSGSGKKTSELIAINDESLTWTYNSTLERFECLSLQGIIKNASANNTVLAGLASSAYTARAATATGSSPVNNTVAVSNAGALFVRDESYSDVTTWKAAMGSQTILYPLATPSDFSTTPITDFVTLYGQNNIFADCGPVDVEYRADTKLYIKRLTGPTDDDMTADANIAAGTYFMVGNNLFLSTASIAAGEAIVPGTNCTATNLAAALNALNS